MIGRPEFINRINNYTYPEEVTQDDLETYYKLFQRVGEDAREKIIPPATRNIIGIAQTQQRKHAIKLMDSGQPGLLPCGGTLMPKDQSEPARVYWKQRIPDTTPIFMCKKEINRLCGSDLLVLLEKGGDNE